MDGKTRPIYEIDDVELKCDCCGKDILHNLDNTIIAYAYSKENNKTVYHDIYFACKGKCDEHLETSIHKQHGWLSMWEDIPDIANPLMYLRYVLLTMNQLYSSDEKYQEVALNKEKKLLRALAQKVFREVTDEEWSKFGNRFRNSLTDGLFG